MLSVASSHMTKEKHVLTNFQEFEEPENVALGDGRVVEALGSGRIQMKMLFPAPEAKKCMMCCTCLNSHVRAIVAKGNAVEFGLNSCCIWDENGRLRGMGSLADKLYQLYCEVVSTGYASVAQSCSDLWHQRLGNVFRMNLCEGLTSRKLRNCHFAKDVWQERCVENRFLQWERLG